MKLVPFALPFLAVLVPVAPTLTVAQTPAAAFAERDLLTEGLGPRMNLDSCGDCHAHPTLGGSSGPINPQIAFATADGMQNTVPPFLTIDGPIREVRFKADSQVHNLFVITGRVDGSGTATGCTITQEDFSQEATLSFRIPTPLFGAGLVEAIPDATIRANAAQHTGDKRKMGIAGVPHVKAAGGKALGRFGWKAQHSSLEAFAAEAYNVEMGITSPLAPVEREQSPACQFAPVPNAVPDGDEPDDVALFVAFMQALPAPSRQGGGDVAAIASGQEVFTTVGCAFCHTPSLSGVPLYSDLLLHRMGTGLADGITQGTAQGDQFRTAPLWGLGSRLFFLHDGRARDLVVAVQAHASAGSEATAVVEALQGLGPSALQDLLAFLGSL